MSCCVWGETNTREVNITGRKRKEKRRAKVIAKKARKKPTVQASDTTMLSRNTKAVSKISV